METPKDDRFALMPEQFLPQHMFCFWLHDQMVNILKQSEERFIADVHFQLRDDEDRRKFREAADPLQFFHETGRDDLAKTLTLRQLVIPLYADILHFVYEGLKALERRKFLVAFTLLRKPLRYDLMLVTWLLAEPDDFYERFRTSPADHLETQALSKEQRIALLDKAIALLESYGLYNGELIYDMVYNKKASRGLAVAFDKAAHPVTNFGKEMRTEPLNLNLIFSSPSDNAAYEHLYWILAVLLIYLLFVQLALIKTMQQTMPGYVEWLRFVTLGTWGALFADDESPPLPSLSEEWSKFAADLMRCVACGAQITVCQSEAARFFLEEIITCPRCATEQQFPLFWLMTAMNLRVEIANTPDDGTA